MHLSKQYLFIYVQIFRLFDYPGYELRIGKQLEAVAIFQAAHRTG